MPASNNETLPLKIRSRLTASHQIALTSTELAPFEALIQNTIEQAPSLFRYAPVVLDTGALDELPDSNTFHELLSICRANKLVPFALTSHQAQHQDYAYQHQLSWIEPRARNTAKDEPKPSLAITKTEVINTPVRSGQQIYAKDANLLITRQVSAGAEVIADGSIQILGALRGKAIAGAQGTKHCEIVCQQMDAELIAIAGIYLVQESINTTAAPARCWLNDDQMQVDYF